MAQYEPVVESHHYHEASEGLSGVMMVVLLLFAVVFAGAVLFALGLYPSWMTGTVGSTGTPNINANVSIPVPANTTSPGGQNY